MLGLWKEAGFKSFIQSRKACNSQI
uniref:Uncharacterized protein n=1 Tax=Arundo donax TaxID=35708 RepID=A0A0A8ZWQ3_ARUDO